MAIINMDLSTEEICHIVVLLEQELDDYAVLIAANHPKNDCYKKEHVKLATLLEKFNKVL